MTASPYLFALVDASQVPINMKSAGEETGTRTLEGIAIIVATAPSPPLPPAPRRPRNRACRRPPCGRPVEDLHQRAPNGRPRIAPVAVQSRTVLLKDFSTLMWPRLRVRAIRCLAASNVHRLALGPPRLRTVLRLHPRYQEAATEAANMSDSSPTAEVDKAITASGVVGLTKSENLGLSETQEGALLLLRN
jgi:hypothetical protein